MRKHRCIVYERVKFAVFAAGIDAFGWLPPKPDADSLVEYAARQGAELVLLSTDDSGLIDALEPVGRIRVETVAPS